MIDLPAAWPLLVVAAFAGFLTSTLLGIGGALIVAPALMLTMPAADAVALVAPVMLCNNVFKGLAFRRHVAWRPALATLLTAAPAAVGGALLVGVVDERALKIGVASLIAAALLSEHALRRTWRFSTRALVVWGVPIGFISGACSAAGPPTAIAFKGHGLVKERFVATVAVLAIGMQLTKIPTYVAAGTLRAEHAPLAGVLVVASLAAVLVGRALMGRVDARRYRRALDVLLILVAVGLVLDAAQRLQ